MYRKPFLLAALLLFLSACTDFTTDRDILAALEKDIQYLADDKLEGRAIGTEGERLAAEYIAQAFEQLGLQPKGTNGYYQEFTVKKPSNPHEEVQINANGEGITGRNVAGFIDNGAANTVVLALTTIIWAGVRKEVSIGEKGPYTMEPMTMPAVLRPSFSWPGC